MKGKFEHFDIEERISAMALYGILGDIIKKCPTAMVSVRQTDGTDFPPFLTIESPEAMEKADNDGSQPNVLI